MPTNIQVDSADFSRNFNDAKRKKMSKSGVSHNHMMSGTSNIDKRLAQEFDSFFNLSGILMKSSQLGFNARQLEKEHKNVSMKALSRRNRSRKNMTVLRRELRKAEKENDIIYQ